MENKNRGRELIPMANEENTAGPMGLEGKRAPDFSLPDQAGKLASLSAHKGKWVALYFYPKDDTPGCTTEACEFRDLNAEFEKQGIKILGVSPDSKESHGKFGEKYGLNFRILSDAGSQVCKKYRVWAEKSMYGKKYMGVLRTTFVISPEGAVDKVFENVGPKGHSSAVLQYIKGRKA